MEDLFGINAHRQAVQENMEKAFTSGINIDEEIEKARSGIYADTAENRRLNRVGQQYGGRKQVEQPNSKTQQNNEKKVEKKNVNSDKEKLAKEFIENAKKEFEKKFPGMKFDVNSSAKSDKDSKEDENKEEKVKKEISKVSSDIDSLGYYLGDNPDEDESGNTRDWSMKEIIAEMLDNKDIVSGVKKLIEKHGVNETYKKLGESSDAFNANEIKRIVLAIDKKTE